jgi:DNA-binding CsgD family transcriptional regulator
MFTLLSRVVGNQLTRKGFRKAEMHGGDSLGLRANVDPNRGVIVTTVVPSGFRIRHRTLWLRLASHIGAAFRLRSAKKNAAPADAAAILTPDGKLAHATAETHAAREDLAQAAKRIDRARGKLRRLDPDEASSVWRAMVRSEWSLVDWFDHDQKRFLVAHDNRILPSKATPKLSAREHQVAACAAMGHSNKLIAYDLGLSTGTVSVVLARAAAKLGVTSRPALIRAFRELGRIDGTRRGEGDDEASPSPSSG